MTVININSHILSEFKSKLSQKGIPFCENEPLSRHCSFKVGGTCPLLIEVWEAEDILSTLALLKAFELSFITLGNGTNVLPPDGGIDEIVLKIYGEKAAPRLVDQETVFCPAGTKLASLCKFALENSLSGLEFAYGIPGTCGGAVFMNAGAYGGEIKDVLQSVCHITPRLTVETVSADSVNLSYRYSDYKKNGNIITGATFKLTKAPKEEIKSKMNDFLGRRTDKQPLDFPSAGSTFKRPEGYFAGALIEQCELKGFSVGGAQVSEKHAGFVINKGSATAKDITDLIAHIAKTVKENTGVTLEPEVIILR